jgi:hypothetical protein
MLRIVAGLVIAVALLVGGPAAPAGGRPEAGCHRTDVAGHGGGEML